MKQIALETLREAAKQNPTAWHQLIAAGTLDASHKYLTIDEAVESKILNGQSMPSLPLKTIFRQEDEIARIQAICEECTWNVNWICEHPGCKPCRQRQSGGLKGLILDPRANCPAHKWH